MMGFELAVGYVCAYLVRKAKRTGGRVDEQVDLVLDASLDRLHTLVQAKLGDSPGLQETEQLSAAPNATAADVTVKAETLRDELRVLSQQDPAFAAELLKAVSEVPPTVKATWSATITDSQGVVVGDGTHAVFNFN